MLVGDAKAVIEALRASHPEVHRRNISKFELLMRWHWLSLLFSAEIVCAYSGWSPSIRYRARPIAMPLSGRRLATKSTLHCSESHILVVSHVLRKELNVLLLAARIKMAQDVV
jgi:hypothetical protein